MLRRYELGELLGEGGMGAVFSAFDTHTRAHVAVKLLKPTGMAASAEDIDRFLREGEALTALNHPNIVKVLDMFQEGDRHYLVMELVRGGSLQTLLGSGPLDLERIVTLALDLSDALARAHRLGIVHRDLKPGNVLLAADGTPRLGDFGVAQIAGKRRLSSKNAIVGTLEYLSPEAIEGQTVDERSDIWAFGILLFEMIAGRRPFRGEHAAATLNAIVHQATPDLESLRPDCPTALVDLVYRMLEKDRAHRIPSARQVGVELESIARGAENPRKPRFSREAFAGTVPAVAPVAPPAVLPAQAIPFVGRETELASLARLLLDDVVRVVTIVGSGGMGKSRLAFEAAQRWASGLGAFARTRAGHATAPEVLIVELAPLASSELVLAALGDAVGLEVRPGSDPRAQLLGFMRNRHALLVMDNFEHVLEAATLVSDLLGGAPHVKVLATSRERLGLSGESAFALSGLAFPEVGSTEPASSFSSVRLFIDGARRARSDFEPSERALSGAARICRLVQGLPLGVVLAASWTSVLDLDEIGDEIARSFDFLSSELRDVPTRQQSLRAVFDYSYGLLQEKERIAFARLAVFRGGFTRAAAEAVAGASLQVLVALTNKSLVTRDPGTGRFGVHELLRQYAETKLREANGELDTALNAHAGHFGAFLAERRARLRRVDAQVAASEIEAELDNVRRAWPRLFEQERVDLPAAALEAFGDFCTLGSAFAEAEAAFASASRSLEQRTSERGSDRARLLARTLTLQAQACDDQWHHAEAHALATRALGLCVEDDHPDVAGAAWVVLAIASFWLGEIEAGLRAADHAVRLHRRAGDAWQTARALLLLGKYRDRLGAETAEAYLRESLELQRHLGRGEVVFADALMELGDNLAERGQFEEGCRLMQEGLALGEARGTAYGTLTCLQHLAAALRHRGEYPAAEDHARRALTLARERFPFAESWCEIILGDALKEWGRLDDAALYFRAAMLDPNPLTTAVARINLADIALQRGGRVEAKAMFIEAAAELERHGATWGIAIACDYLGHLACDEGRLSEAELCFNRAYETARSARLLPLALGALAGLARFQALAGEPEAAVALSTFVSRQTVTEHQTHVRRVEPLLAELARRLPPETFEAALQRGRDLTLETAERVLSARR